MRAIGAVYVALGVWCAASPRDVARRVGFALESDSATLFATAVLRNLAPDVILIAGVNRAENVSRIHRAGADFALSVIEESITQAIGRIS